jgi:hypothetical protein
MTTIADLPLPGRARLVADPKALRAQLPLAAVCAELEILPDESGKAFCPWHEADGQRHNPSFRLWTGSDGVQRYCCDPCQRHGDLFDLVRDQLGLSFPQALRWASELLATLPADYRPPSFKVAGRAAKPWSEKQQAEWTRELERVQRESWVRFGTLTRLGGFPAGEARLWERHLRSWGWVARRPHVLWIPHWSVDGALTGLRIRRYRRRSADEEQFWTKERPLSIPGSSYPELYGAWHGRKHRTVLLAEGEPDTVWADRQAHERGLPLDVYGLPRGAGSRVSPAWLEFLEGATIFTGFDTDEAGCAMTEKFNAAAERAGLDCQPFVFAVGAIVTDLREAAPDLSVLVRGREVS